MEEEDRQRIISNLVELVEQTNLNTLIPELLERRVFTYEMIHKYVVSNNQQICFWKSSDFHSTAIFELVLLGSVLLCWAHLKLS
jgi:hypothetical protein